jgi:hypothetical protein
MSTVDWLSASTRCLDQKLTGLAQTPDCDGDASEVELTASTGVFIAHMRDIQKYSARVHRQSASTRKSIWLLLLGHPIAATTEEKDNWWQTLLYLLLTIKTQAKPPLSANRLSTLTNIDDSAQSSFNGRRPAVATQQE